jgi:sodium-dependent dicarboxylate transporter 2/3/5
MSKEATAVKRAEQAFDRKRRTIGLFGGPLLAILVFMTPIAGLTLAAHKLLAIMVLVALWWITEPVPIPVTSLIGPTLAVITGVVPVGTAFAAFANPMIFLFMGGFILAKAMMTHGLDKRFAYWLLSRSWVGSNPKRIFPGSRFGRLAMFRLGQQHGHCRHDVPDLSWPADFHQGNVRSQWP